MEKDLFGKEVMSKNIEVIRLHRMDGEPIKAFCDIQFGNAFVIKGFKVIQGTDGLFVGMPSEMGKSGRWFNTFTPLTEEVKNKITEEVLRAYEG